MGSYGVQEDRGSSVRSDPVKQSGYIGFLQTITAYFYLFQQLVYLVGNFCFAGAQQYMLRVSFFLYDLLGTCFVVMRRVSFRSFRQYISPTHPSRYF